MLKLVMQDVGLGVLPGHLIGLMPKSQINKLTQLVIPGKSFSNPVSMVTLPIRSPSRPALAIIEFIKDELNRRMPMTSS